MGSRPETVPPVHPDYHGWLRGSLVFLGLLVVGRFVLEIAGVSPSATRYLSSSALIYLVAIYLGAVAPLHNVRKLVQLIIPSLAVATWTVGWVILFTLISGIFQLQRSHFAEKNDYGNWANLGTHVLEHAVEVPVVALLVLIVAAVPFLLWRWPVTVGPAAIIGALTIIRYWVEAMGQEPARGAAWSSTVAVLISGFYLGGVGPRLGPATGSPPRAKNLFVPALVIAWTWRFWIFLAILLSALVPFYKTHFFDPSGGNVPVRLAQSLAGGAVEGFVYGLLIWGIAVWMASATRATGNRLQGTVGY
jgi:hypothetical protein